MTTPLSHAKVSPSSLYRTLACPASLEAQTLLPDKPQTSAASEGTRLHDLAESLWNMDVSLSEIDEEDARVLAGYIALLQRYADDLDTEPHIELKLMAPKMFKDQLWGTADAVFVTNHTLVVVDLKTGRVPVDAVGNWQLTAYAALAMEYFGLWDRVSEIEVAIYSPNSADGVAFKNEIMDKATLRQRLYHIREGVNFALSDEGKVTFRPGEAQCRWCKLAGQCKAQLQTSLALDFMSEPAVEETPDEAYLRFAALTDSELSNLVARAPEFQNLLARALDAARDRLLSGSKLDNLKLVRKRTLRKWSSPGAVLKVLEASGLDEEKYSSRKLKTPTQAAKEPDVLALVGDMIVKPLGEPVVAPLEDKRPSFDPSEDFENE